MALGARRPLGGWYHARMAHDEVPTVRIPAFTGAVLAGGKARRFTSDKCLHPYRGKALLEHALASLDGASERFVVGRPEADALGARWIPDTLTGKGAASGLHAALRAANHDWVAIVGCDMPFLPPTVWDVLFAHAEGVRIVLPESAGGLEPLAALYHRDLLPVVEARLVEGAAPLRWFVKDVPSRIVPWSRLRDVVPAHAFLNANRPEDLP